MWTVFKNIILILKQIKNLRQQIDINSPSATIGLRYLSPISFLRHVDDFLWYFRFPPPIKLTATI